MMFGTSSLSVVLLHNYTSFSCEIAIRSTLSSTLIVCYESLNRNRYKSYLKSYILNGTIYLYGTTSCTNSESKVKQWK